MDLPLPRLRVRLGRLGSTRTGVFFLGIMILALRAQLGVFRSTVSMKELAAKITGEQILALHLKADRTVTSFNPPG